MHKTDKRLKKILQEKVEPVYIELAAKIGQAKSQIMPHLFKRLVTLEQANILNSLPATTEEIAKKFNLSKENLDKQMQPLFEKGLAFPGKTSWKLTRTWIELHDAIGSANTEKYKELDNDFYELCEAMMESHFESTIDDVVSGKMPTIRQVMRVIPRWKAIENVPGVLPFEDIREIFKTSGTMVLIPCACKKCTPGRACKDKITGVTCITCGRAGEYNLKRGTGKQLNYDEVMELFDSLDQYQLVHLTDNNRKMPALVCNCHNCCCGMFILNAEARKRLNQFEIAKSRFQAFVDPEKCKGCRLCVDTRCPVGAAQMKYYPELGAERSSVNAEECIGCGLCVITCPAKARSLKIVRPPEHVPEAGLLPPA